MIDFPANPTVGQQYSAAGVTWIFDGTKWTPAGASTAVVQAMNDNRVINADMRINQRGAASGTAGGYTVDRWYFGSSQTGKGTWGQAGADATLAKLGFGYYLSWTSQAAYTPVAADVFYFSQPIEADAITDFMWGTAQAQPVTLSFIVYSSVTGQLGGAISNYANTHAYPFTFNVTTPNVFTKYSITIPGDTTGTWVSSGNGGALSLVFDLGCGSSHRAPAGAWVSGNYQGANGSANIVGVNGAFFGITGVKLEIGSIATPFNRQSLAKSLADCQRYYTVLTNLLISGSVIAAGNPVYNAGVYPVSLRVNPGSSGITFSSVSYSNASNLIVGGGSPTNYQFNINVTNPGSGYALATVAASAEL